MTHGEPSDIDLQRHSTQDAPAYEEQKVTWLELFFDLIFVVAFDQLAKRLGDSPGAENIAEFLLMFTAVWWAWAGNTVFAARYGNDSRAYRWGTLAQLISLGMLALTLRGDLNDTGLAFALAYGVNRVIQMGLYLAILRERPDVGPFARRMAASLGVVSVIWLASAWWPGGSSAQVLAWCVALALDLLTPVLIRAQRRQALPHEGHLPERVGLLQIIALGAIVTEIVNGSRQQALSVATLLPALAGIVTTVALWRLYFDQARALPLLGAHLEGRVGRMLAWLYGHLPFTLSVIMLGVGLGHGISVVDAKKDTINQQFVAWPLVGALLTLAYLRWHSLRASRRPIDRSLIALALGAALVATLAFIDLDTMQLHLAVAALSVVLGIVVATDPATRTLGKIEEQVMEQLEEGQLEKGQPPEQSNAGNTICG